VGLELITNALGMTTPLGALPCEGEKLDEVFDPLLPGSEQLRLQQRRAIETSAVLFAACAFLQQSGRFDIGHEPSFSYAPTPTTPLSIAETSMNAVSHLRIVVFDYIERIQ